MDRHGVLQDELLESLAEDGTRSSPAVSRSAARRIEELDDAACSSMTVVEPTRTPSTLPASVLCRIGDRGEGLAVLELHEAAIEAATDRGPERIDEPVDHPGVGGVDLGRRAEAIGGVEPEPLAMARMRARTSCSADEAGSM